MAFFSKQLLTTQMHFFFSCLSISKFYSLLNLEISEKHRASRPNSLQVLGASISSCLTQTFRDSQLIGDPQEQQLTWNLD